MSITTAAEYSPEEPQLWFVAGHPTGIAPPSTLVNRAVFHALDPGKLAVSQIYSLIVRRAFLTRRWYSTSLMRLVI